MEISLQFPKISLTLHPKQRKCLSNNYFQGVIGEEDGLGEAFLGLGMESDVVGHVH